jgi:hypothetical protein
MVVDIGVVTQMVSTLGFPIAMCMYFVIRFEKTIQKHTDTLIEFLQEVKKGA